MRASGTGQLDLPTCSSVQVSAEFVLRMAVKDLLRAGQLWQFEGFHIAGVLKQLWKLHVSALGLLLKEMEVLEEFVRLLDHSKLVGC